MLSPLTSPKLPFKIATIVELIVFLVIAIIHAFRSIEDFGLSPVVRRSLHEGPLSVNGPSFAKPATCAELPLVQGPDSAKSRVHSGQCAARLGSPRSAPGLQWAGLTSPGVGCLSKTGCPRVRARADRPTPAGRCVNLAAGVVPCAWIVHRLCMVCDRRKSFLRNPLTPIRPLIRFWPRKNRGRAPHSAALAIGLFGCVVQLA
jgi:hypothetical protein